MKKVLVCAALASVLVCGQAWAGEACCRKAEAESGWCTGHEVGFNFTIPVKMKQLYETLSAKPAGEFKCAGCKQAARTNGTCDYCKVGVANGNVYQSPYAHAIAVGKRLNADKVGCKGCAKTVRNGDHGWCEGCNAGVVAGYGFKDKKKYDHAVDAMKIIKTAAKKKCEACAVGLVTDGKCGSCKVSYKEGRAIKS